MPANEPSKHILFDTCFIDKIFETSSDSVENFIRDIFGDNKITACIHPLIYLEFIRKSKNKKERDKIAEFLKDQFIELPLSNDIFDVTKEIYPLYSRCKKIENYKQASVVDAISLGFLKKFGRSLSLITLDINDYPFEMISRKAGIKDMGYSIITWAICEFDQDKFTKLLENYNNYN